MCDYSLHAVASRPARVGDRLMTTHFPDSITHGLATVTQPQVAVCLLPGTEVAFDRVAEYEHPFGWLRNRTTTDKVARFRKVNMANSHTHHDAFEFPGEKLILVTRLIKNQFLTVLQLPVAACRQDEKDAVQSKHAPVSINP